MITARNILDLFEEQIPNRKLFIQSLENILKKVNIGTSYEDPVSKISGDSFEVKAEFRNRKYSTYDPDGDGHLILSPTAEKDIVNIIKKNPAFNNFKDIQISVVPSAEEEFFEVILTGKFPQ